MAKDDLKDKETDDAVDADDATDDDKPQAKDASDVVPMTRRHVMGALGVGLLAGAGGGFFAGQYFGGRRRGGKPKPPPKPAHVTIEGWNPSKGPNPARVTMIVFTDFQCPFCKRAADRYDKLLKAYPDDVRMVVRHRPLEFHKKAKLAAVAMLAAGLQGKAWEMHDKMFNNRKQLDREHLEGYAKELGLDTEAFSKALDDSAIAEQVEKDNSYAQSLGAAGTPTTFINGRGVRGAKRYATFEAIVKEEIAEAKKLEEAGTPVAELYAARCKANIAAGAAKATAKKG